MCIGTKALVGVFLMKNEERNHTLPRIIQKPSEIVDVKIYISTNEFLKRYFSGKEGKKHVFFSKFESKICNMHIYHT